MSKLSFIIFSLVLLVCLTAASSQQEESSLAEETNLSSLRTAREADAKRRGKKRGKKQRKMKRRKSKKGRKQKKLKKSSKPKISGRSVSDACFEQSITVMRMWKDVVTNFEKQKNRMEKQNGTGGSKAEKKGAFDKIAQNLLAAGGGNKSQFTCGGSTDNDGAKQLKNLTDTLFACKDNVKMACDPANIPQPNMTKLMMCSEAAMKFKTAATMCLFKSIGANKTDTTTACTCWTGDDLTMAVAEVKDCKFSKEAKAVSNALKNCTKAFSTCRKFEDDAATSIASCNSDSSKLTKKAETLSTNKVALAAANAKVASLTDSSRRALRAASSCAEVLKYAKQLATAASNFPESPKIQELAAKITGAGSITCSTEEKKSLTEVSAELTEAETTLDNALEAVQEQIMTLTGSTAMVSGMTTKASRRQRERNFRF